MTLTHEPAGRGVALLDRIGRVRFHVAGPDRAKFLHNLTTQDTKRLPVGEGREAFVTSPQGKTLGYVTLLAADDHLILRSDREGWAPLPPHLGKYGVFDDVTLDDVSETTFELHLAGPAVGTLLEAAGLGALPAVELGHRAADVVGVPVRLVRETLVPGGGATLIGPVEGRAAVEEAIRTAAGPGGLAELDAAEFDRQRIEQGIPVAGRDVTPDNLPQEVARDDRTINFVKGCYLGQETVARIDALGHVNRLLRGLMVSGQEPPAPGTPLEADGKVVGAITSAAVAPDRGGVVALGYVRTSHSRAGTVVRVGGDRPADATVTDLPMPPR